MLPYSYSVLPVGVGVAVVVAVFPSSAIANTVRLLNPATDVSKRHTAADGGRVTTPWNKTVFDFSPIDVILLSYLSWKDRDNPGGDSDPDGWQYTPPHRYKSISTADTTRHGRVPLSQTPETDAPPGF